MYADESHAENTRNIILVCLGLTPVGLFNCRFLLSYDAILTKHRERTTLYSQANE